MEPYFKENDKQMFYKYIDTANYYFEYGSGGSTYQSSIRNNVKQIFSVESDLEWHNKLKTILKDKNHIRFIYNEMDVEPNTWGTPGKNSTADQQKNYSNQILKLDPDTIQNINMVLIDGRFRVACCLKCFDVIHNNCLIAFDDFLNRPEYHVCLNYYDILEETSDNCMVILKKKQNISCIPDELIEKYELNSD
jgi:hypothetical protein